jgi:hypothetical protein
MMIAAGAVFLVLGLASVLLAPRAVRALPAEARSITWVLFRRSRSSAI